MLIIRREQLETLSADRTEAYLARVIEHIAVEYPIEYAQLREDGAARVARAAVDTGARHGITGEGSVLTLAELMVEFGERFELSPDRTWAATILEHPRLPGVLKAQVVAERMRARTDGRRIVQASAAAPAGDR